MLIKSIKTNDKLVIGDGVTIQLIEKKDGQMRLGIDAPDHFSIVHERENKILHVAQKIKIETDKEKK